MHHFIFSRGPIKLYPLPGTEEYVAKVARWLAGNLLKEAEKQKADLAEILYLDEDEAAELDKHLSTREDTLEFIVNTLTGHFDYLDRKSVV